MADTAAPQPGTPEYDAAMAAKVDESAKAAEVAANGEPPVETPKEPTETTAEAKKEEAPKDGEEDAAKAAVAEAGLDYAALQEEYAKDGQLSEESFQKLEKAGIPRSMTQEFIQGQEARAELMALQAAEVCGGKDKLTEIQSWASKALSPEDIAAYNKAVAGPKEEMLKAVEGLKSRYEATYGKAPNLLGGSPSTPAAQGYASKAEMTADMRDPRYAKDPAFRSKVMAKVAATTAF